VPLHDLDCLDVLLPLPGTAFRDDLDDACRKARVTLHAKAEIDGVRLLASLTFEGHGPAILPATALPGSLTDRWRAVALDGVPRRHIGIAQRRHAQPAAPARTVLGLIREVLSDGAELPVGIHAAG
jgi:hypothetical protein